MEKKEYTCRKLKSSDLEKVMYWRMSPRVTRYMNTDPVITMVEQVSWFDRLSSSNESYYWIIEVDSKPCGLINLADLDRTHNRSGWAYYIAENKLNSFHLAISLEMSLYTFAFDKLGLNKIIGNTFCINTAAIKMHELCGCETEGILKQHILKNNKYYDVCIQSMLAEKWECIRNNFKFQYIVFETSL